MMDLVRLSHEHNLSGFDCDDKDLNGFLTDERFYSPRSALLIHMYW